MFISKVKPDIQSIVHFFDYQHQFYTSVEVYFSHHNQNLRALLLFPYYKKGHFVLEKIEIFLDNQWMTKKGDSQQYGVALAENDIIVLLGNSIANHELEAKKQLEKRFKALVKKLAVGLEKEIQPIYPVKCEISSDYLSILTRFDVNGQVIAGRIESNFYFSDTVNDEELLQELLMKNVEANLENLKKYQFIQDESNEEQRVFVTTVPLLNPISDQSYSSHDLNVSIYYEGYCHSCEMNVQSNDHSSVKVNLQKLEQHKDDLLIMVVGNRFVCEKCNGLVKKQEIVMTDIRDNTLLSKKTINSLYDLGHLKEQEKIEQILEAAAEHDSYFRNNEALFWQSFTYIAGLKWDTFIQELTQKELAFALHDYLREGTDGASKEELLAKLNKLKLSAQDKEKFWKKANQLVIEHYLFTTIFAWDLKQEIDIIGPNRAEFIFQYLPIPNELKGYYQIFEAYFSKQKSQTAAKLHKSLERQQEQMRELQQENGRLTQKLGEAYSRISELEQASDSISTEVRNKRDILKIQQLKGLVDELKKELSLISKVENKVESTPELILSEEKSLPDQEVVSLDEVFHGKNILILGGYRDKQFKEEKGYAVYTHGTRDLDPSFYELLKNADIVIILTRYISHRAMWEAKEHAIMEEKPIFFSTFTNIPTILLEIANEIEND